MYSLLNYFEEKWCLLKSGVSFWGNPETYRSLKTAQRPSHSEMQKLSQRLISFDGGYFVVYGSGLGFLMIFVCSMGGSVYVSSGILYVSDSGGSVLAGQEGTFAGAKGPGGQETFGFSGKK